MTAPPVADPGPPPVAAAAPAFPAASPDLRVVQALVPFPASREQEMSAYSLRHYDTASWQLTPTMVVLHYTAGVTWAGARATFAADTVNMGELPGVCSHYVVDQDGTVYQLVPTSVRCRHTIGLNDQAIGIEMVQDGGPSASWADQQILNRPAQVGAALALVRSLQAQFGIPTASVIGPAMANTAPQFHDRLGWSNDHEDWQAGRRSRLPGAALNVVGRMRILD
jgi:N-acetyl-anhydromuramyl-L-alanine amidase AmpD